MSVTQKLIAAAIFVALTVGSGIWLSALSKPYNPALFNVHKIIALAGVIFTVLTFVALLKQADATFVLILMLIICALCIIVLFASGILLSAGKFSYPLLKTIHAISPIIGIGTGGIAIWMLFKIMNT